MKLTDAEILHVVYDAHYHCTSRILLFLMAPLNHKTSKCARAWICAHCYPFRDASSRKQEYLGLAVAQGTKKRVKMAIYEVWAQVLLLMHLQRAEQPIEARLCHRILRTLPNDRTANEVSGHL